MNAEATPTSPTAPAHKLRNICAYAALSLALLLLIATAFLLSPQPGRTYPSAIPWAQNSLLHSLTDALALHNSVATVRGVEIKDFVLHCAAALGLLLLAFKAITTHTVAQRAFTPARTAGYAHVLLVSWVMLSLVSGLWTNDPGFARGQAGIYALNIAWTVALAYTFDARLLRPFLRGVLCIGAAIALVAIWYYYERNPYHRASFPIGNPTTLAAMLVPPLLIAGCLLAERFDKNRPPAHTAVWDISLALLTLVPLMWCFLLTRSRGATLALLVGAAVIVVYRVGPRLRWVFAGILGAGVLAAGTWWYYASHLELTMARGATLRFRLYAWRYAAELWSASPFSQIAGHGAGAYPRLAGALSTTDRTLDPAAFMAELVESAHNELFEVLTEIGLVGGVTFVGGFVATFAAAVWLVRARQPHLSRWLTLAIIGGVAALLADSMVGRTLRLPGPPALFFTLLGILWALCRTAPEIDRPVNARSTARAPNFVVAVALLVAAGGAGWLAQRNWSGVLQEQAAHAATQRGDLATAVTLIEQAEPLLFDPVRKIEARHVSLRCRANLATDAFRTWKDDPQAPTAHDNAVHQALIAYQSARKLRGTVPALLHTDATAARMAELLGELYRQQEAIQSAMWQHRAHAAWRQQRQRTPHDVRTLLALRRFPGTLANHIGLLRDALREGPTDGPWLESLVDLSRQPQFEQQLDALVAATGPLTPQTDLDSLIASRAPEMLRLSAAFHAQQGNYAQAAAEAERAANLYIPMRPRFPRLYPIALAEQADYVFAAGPNQPQAAVNLLQKAIAALPTIQREKYADMARPFRFRLARCLLAAGDVEQALAIVTEALAPATVAPEFMGALMLRLINDAAAAGVDPQRINAIRAALCPQFENLCN